MQEFIPYIIGLLVTLGAGTAAFFFSRKPKQKLLKEHNRLRIEDSLAYFQQLKDYIKHRKPYLETPLTLKDVAARMELPLPYLNQAVKDHAGGNFDHFINEFRVKKAQELLQSPESSSYKLTQIASDSGFKNQDQFEKAFKQYVGKSPSAYKKSIQ